MEIRIFDTSVNFIAAIDNFQELQFQRRLYSAGVFTLALDKGILYANELQKDRIIVVNGSAGIIEEVKYEDNNLTVSGYELKGIMKRRITKPAVGQSHITFTTDPSELVLKGLASVDFPNLEIATNLNRGINISVDSRYRNTADELERVARAALMGWDIQLNTTTKKLVFDVIENIDHSSTSANPVFFSKKYDNIARQDYTKSYFNSANVAIVAGQGTGASRTIEEVGTATGYDRYETFIDARDIDTTPELIARGTSNLSQMKFSEVFNCTIKNVTFIYKTDWDLGSTVTIQDEQLGISLDRIVESVTEFYNARNDFTIVAEFGNSQSSIKKYIDLKTDYGVD